jgi:hypothetical protein
VALKYLVPDILGHPREIGVLSKELVMAGKGPFFQQNYVSTTGYLGVLPLLLGVVAITALRRKAVPLVVLSAVSLLAVFGTPLLHAFYRLLPGFNFSRIDRVIVIYMCSMAVLAGYGFDAARILGKRRLVAAGAFIVLALVSAAWFRGPGWEQVHGPVAGAVAPEAYMGYALPKVSIFMVLAVASGLIVLASGLRRMPGWIIVGAAICLLLADLLPNGVKFKVSQPAGDIVPASTVIGNLKREGGTWRFAKFGAEVIPSNTATILGLHDIHGYDALNVNRYMEVLGTIDSTMIAASNAALRRRIGPISYPEALSSRVLDMLNVKYLMSVADLGGARPNAVSLPNAGYLPRAFLVPRARFFGTYGEILTYMKSGDFDPAVEVLLQGPRGSSAQVPEDLVPGSATLVEYTPHRVSIDVEVERDSYLFLSDVHYPGWKATIEGEEVDLLRANYAFRAVRLSPGSHTVRMEYVPLYFRIGLIFSAAGAGLVTLMLASRRRFD